MNYKLFIYMHLICVASYANNYDSNYKIIDDRDITVSIARENFKGSLAGFSSGSYYYPREDSTLDGYSCYIGKKLHYDNLTSMLYGEIGVLQGTYQNKNTDITYLDLGYKVHLGNENAFFRPIVGVDYTNGEVKIPDYQNGLNYTFSTLGYLYGVDFKITNDTRLEIFIQEADNSGAKYKRTRFGLSYSF